MTGLCEWGMKEIMCVDLLLKGGGDVIRWWNSVSGNVKGRYDACLIGILLLLLLLNFITDSLLHRCAGKYVQITNTTIKTLHYRLQI